MIKEQNTYVAIIAGGIGSRFWPNNSTPYPKQFLDIFNKGESLLQTTYKLYNKIVPSKNIFIITSKDYVNLVKGQIPQCPGKNIIGKRERKNTDPCIAIITDKINKIDPFASLIVAPSDKIIERDELFMADMTSAISLARQGRSVTFGIKPTHLHTDNDYIKYNRIDQNRDECEVIDFIEKPELELAKQFLSLGNYLWNAGIFVWNVKALLHAFEKYNPQMHRSFQNQKHLFNTNKEEQVLKNLYAQCGIFSIDHTVLEKADHVYVIAAGFTWVGLGTPNINWKYSGQGSKGRILPTKKTGAFDLKDSLVFSSQKDLCLSVKSKTRL